MESVREMPASERAQLMRLLDKLMSGMTPPNDGRLAMLFQDEEAPAKPRRAPRAKKS